jgi:hypothetical protein
MVYDGNCATRQGFPMRGDDGEKAACLAYGEECQNPEDKKKARTRRAEGTSTPHFGA